MPVSSGTFSNPKLKRTIHSKNCSLEFFIFAVLVWVPMTECDVCSDLGMIKDSAVFSRAVYLKIIPPARV